MNQVPNTGAAEYQATAGQSFAAPTASLTIKYNKVTAIAAATFYIMFGGLSLLLLLTNGMNQRTILMVVMMLSLVGLMVFLRARAQGKSVKSFDGEGVLASGGQKLLWADFRGRVLRTSMRRGRVYVWRTELIFTGNRQLWILPQRIKNIDEVSRFLNTLPLAKAGCVAGCQLSVVSCSLSAFSNP